MDVSLAGNKRKKTKAEKPYVSIDFDILQPGGNKYSENDYQELKRQNAIVDEASLDGDLHNVGPVDFLRRLEAKYSNKGKKYRFEEEDIANRNYDGYEDEDGFIDDSEAFEEQLPSTMETLKGGFYVNKGSLELKELNESQFAVDEEEEDDEQSVVEEGTSSGSEEKRKEEKKKLAEPVRMVGGPPTLTRMVGGPPTMKRTFSEADRMANEAKRKKVVPPVAVPSVMKKASPPEVQKAKSSDSVIVLDDEPSVKQKSPQVAPSSSAPAPSTAASTPSSSSQKPTTPVKPAISSAETILRGQKTIEFLKIAERFPVSTASRQTVIQQLCAEFFNAAITYFLGGKKRLDDATIDAIIKIEDFYKNEHVVKSQRVAVQESISSFLSIHRSTVMSKTQQRRNELEARAKHDKDDDIQVIPSPSSSKPSTLPTTIKEVQMGLVKHWSQNDVNNINMAISSLRKNTPSFNDLAILYAIQEANTHNLSVGSASQKLLNFRPTPDMMASLSQSLNNSTTTTTTTSKPMRKSRVYLNVWVKESTDYLNMMLKRPQKTAITTGKLAEERDNVVKMLKAAAEKSKEMHRKAVADALKNNTSAPNLTFTFTDVLIGALFAFIETIYACTLMQKKPSLPVSAISSIHKVVVDDICEAMFFIELARRLPKIAYVLDLPEIKKMLADSKLFVDKYQVVQNSKYMLKWPEGTEQKKAAAPIVPPKPIESSSSPAKLSTLSRPVQPSPSTSKSAVSINQQPSTSTASSSSSSASKSTTPQKIYAPVAASSAQPIADKLKAVTDQIVLAQLYTRLQQNPAGGAAVLASLRSQYGDGPVKVLEDRLRVHLEEQDRKQKEEHEKQRKHREAIEARKKLEEVERQRKIREILVARQQQEEAEKQRKAEEAERARKLAEEKRRAKIEEKQRKEKEAREKREREAREARERKEREERERREAQEALIRLAEEQRRQREAEEKARLEEERRLRMEKEKLENEKAAERARELERMRSRQREEELESKPMIQKVQQTSNYSDSPSQYVPDLPPVRIKQEIKDSVVTMNPQTSYTTPNTSMNFNQSFQNNTSIPNHQQIPASPSSSNYVGGGGGTTSGQQQQMMSQQTSMMAQSPQQYMMSPSNTVQQYSQNMIQQNLMFVQQHQQQQQQQQQQQMLRQQQVQAQANQQQQQQYNNWNNMMEQQQQQREFAAQLQQQRQLQLQMQQQQQQQHYQQQNFQNYGNGYNNSR